MNGPCWPLQPYRNTTHLNVVAALSVDHCDRATMEGQRLPLKPGGLDSGRHDTEVRRSTIGFYSPRDHAWLFEHVRRVAVEMNEKHFGFELWGIEAIQYCEYGEAIRGGYEAHRDVYEDSVVRKLSFSIQLSDDGDYDGGDLELYVHKVVAPLVARRERGAGLMFPSWTIHRVAPVTRGMRRALVAWMVGPEFR